MKLFFPIALGAALLLAGCSSSEPLAEAPPPPPPKKGCTDRQAVNFNISAKLDDGSCRYDEVVTDYFCAVRDMASVRIGMTKLEVKNKLGIFPHDIMGAEDGCEIHIYQVRTAAQEIAVKDMEVLQVQNDGFRIYQGGLRDYRLFFRQGRLESILSDQSEKGLPHALACLSNSMPAICSGGDDYVVCTGCTDPVANNYDAGAEEDDGSCTYDTGCTDPEASNYDQRAVYDDGGCVYIGCTDPDALNYNAGARHKQSTCEYCPCDTETHYYIKSNNPRCSDPCIKMPRAQKLDQAPECSWCTLLEKSGNAAIQIVVEGVNMNKQ